MFSDCGSRRTTFTHACTYICMCACTCVLAHARAVISQSTVLRFLRLTCTTGKCRKCFSQGFCRRQFRCSNRATSTLPSRRPSWRHAQSLFGHIHRLSNYQKSAKEPLDSTAPHFPSVSQGEKKALNLRRSAFDRSWKNVLTA